VAGKVYDVTDSFLWKAGRHQVFHDAGKNLTAELTETPHGADLLFPASGFWIPALDSCCRGARHLTAFTGTGISVERSIPPFCGGQTRRRRLRGCEQGCSQPRKDQPHSSHPWLLWGWGTQRIK
jgi:hypothetical protein